MPALVITTVAFAHATGFCGGVWDPVITALDGNFSTLAWDFPNHGSSLRVPHPVDWWTFGRWALEQVGSQRGPVIGVGHSMGGAALTMAEVLSPGTFEALVLIEPMLFPPPYLRAENHLSVAVRKRRRSFTSREDARDNFASKSPFSTWQPQALEGYLECGLIEAQDGTYEVACTPEAEADVYEGATAHAAWERLGEVGIPVLIIGGSESEPQPPDRVEEISRQFPRAGFEIIPEANHFLPMENPGLVATRIKRIASAFKTGPAEPSPD